MIFGLGGRGHDSQKQLMCTSALYNIHFQHTRKCRFVFGKDRGWKSSELEDREFGKRRAPKESCDPFNKHVKILNMGSISSRKPDSQMLNCFTQVTLNMFVNAMNLNN